MTASWGVGVQQELTRQLSTAEKRISRALARHRPVDPVDDEPAECTVCSVLVAGVRWAVPWPCDTVLTLDPLAVRRA